MALTARDGDFGREWLPSDRSWQDRRINAQTRVLTMEGGFAGFDSKQERLHETYAIVQSVQGQQRITLVKGRQRDFFLLQSVTLLGKEKQGGWADDR
jgi:hypothetical protein